MNLQSHFDEQAEVHERLLCARPAKHEQLMKSYTTAEPGVDVPGKGLTFYIKGDWMDIPPKLGEIVKINGETYRANYVSHRRSDASKLLFLEIGTIHAPQDDSRPTVDTETPTEEESGLKSKETAFVAELDKAIEFHRAEPASSNSIMVSLIEVREAFKRAFGVE
jgi:hypothetical protein